MIAESFALVEGIDLTVSLSMMTMVSYQATIYLSSWLACLLAREQEDEEQGVRILTEVDLCHIK